MRFSTIALFATSAAGFVSAVPSRRHSAITNAPEVDSRGTKTSFFFEEKSIWLEPGGGSSCSKTVPSTYTAKGVSCPSNWLWHITELCCVPSYPSVSTSSPSCSSGCSWSKSNLYCTRGSGSGSSGSSSCEDGEFWYPGLSCCLTRGNGGGSDCQPKPPSGIGKSCPTGGNWVWHKKKSCCVPTTPSVPSTPSCPTGPFDSTNYCCHSSGPSQAAHKRRSVAPRIAYRALGQVDPERCPSGMRACPISAAVGETDYECLDTLSELDSCGGCTLLSEGIDCTSIPFVKGSGVTCLAGACSVSACVKGYSPSANGTSCVPTSSATFQIQA